MPCLRCIWGHLGMDCNNCLFNGFFPPGLYLAIYLSITVSRSLTYGVTTVSPHPLAAPTLGDEEKWSVWCEVYMKHKLRLSGAVGICLCRAVADITNCFLIRCKSVSRILILFRDHYRARENLSVLMDDRRVSRNFNTRTKGPMGRWEEHQTDGFICCSHITQVDLFQWVAEQLQVVITN